MTYYTQAMRSQIQYRNLHHVSYWEIAIASLALWQLGPEEKVSEDVTGPKEEKSQIDKVETPEQNGVSESESETKVEHHKTDEKGHTGWEGGSLAAWRELEKEATVSSLPPSPLLSFLIFFAPSGRRASTHMAWLYVLLKSPMGPSTKGEKIQKRRRKN